MKIVGSNVFQKRINTIRPLRWLQLLEQRLKNSIIPTCGMQRFGKSCCAMSLGIFCIMIAVQFSVFHSFSEESVKVQMSDQVKLLSAYSGIFFLALGFMSLMALLLVQEVHSTISVASFTISLIAAFSNLLIGNGLPAASVNSSGQMTIHIRWAEWTACAPLLVFVLGHITQVHPKFVFLAMAAQTGVVLLGYGAEVVGTLWGKALLFVAALVLFMFTTLCIYIVSVQLGHHRATMQKQWSEQSSGQDPDTVKLLGVCVLVFWTLFPLAFMLHLIGALSDTNYLLSKPCLDVLGQASFLGIVNIMQFKLQLTAKNQHISNLKNEQQKQSRLLRFVYHEIHNPLNSILLALDHLESEVQLGEHSPVLSLLRKSTGAMFQVIQDIVELAKHQGGVKLRWEPVSMEQAVQMAVSNFADIAKKKDIKVVVQIEDNIPSEVLGDIEKLQKIFETLVSNAIKFSPVGEEVKVALKIEKFYTPQLCTMNFSVSDSGPGIPPEVVAHIFEPFAVLRPGDFSEDENRGSGLSLCMLKQLADLMHAEVAYKTAKDKGTTFTVFLRCEVYKGKPEKGRESFSIFGSTAWNQQGLLRSPKFSQHVRQRFFATTPSPAESGKNSGRKSSVQNFFPLPASPKHGRSVYRKPKQTLLRPQPSTVATVLQPDENADSLRRSIQSMVSLLKASKSTTTEGAIDQEKPAPCKKKNSSFCSSSLAGEKKYSSSHSSPSASSDISLFESKESEDELLQVPPQRSGLKGEASKAIKTSPSLFSNRKNSRNKIYAESSSWKKGMQVENLNSSRSVSYMSSGNFLDSPDFSPKQVEDKKAIFFSEKRQRSGQLSQNVENGLLPFKQQTADAMGEMDVLDTFDTFATSDQAGKVPCNYELPDAGILKVNTSQSAACSSHKNGQVEKDSPCINSRQGGCASPENSVGTSNTKKRRPNLQIIPDDTPSGGSGAEILVVDDVQSNLKMTSMILMKAGYHCEVAKNGQEAVDMARLNRYKLIFMDNTMPVLDGVEATRQILSFDKSVTIVGVTGNIMDEDQQAFLAAGAVSIVQKPATKEKLLRLCELYIRKQRQLLT